MSTARAGSIATKATSHAFALSPSTTLPAASKSTSSTGTPSRRASSRARSTDTPRASPVAASLVARIGLPKLIAARNFPLGARLAAAGDASGVTGATAQAVTARAKAIAKRSMFQSLNQNGNNQYAFYCRCLLGLWNLACIKGVAHTSECRRREEREMEHERIQLCRNEGR